MIAVIYIPANSHKRKKTPFLAAITIRASVTGGAQERNNRKDLADTVLSRCPQIRQPNFEICNPISYNSHLHR